jgi:hypothetical protein
MRPVSRGHVIAVRCRFDQLLIVMMNNKNISAVAMRKMSADPRVNGQTTRVAIYSKA